MRMLLTAALALIAATQAPAQTPAAPAAAPDYAQESAWVCLPGRKDVCATPLGTVALNANGYGSVGQVTPAANPKADCFYVYPTVSRDPGLSSDLTPGATEELGAALVQFARFGTVCRTFAPLYRQATLASIVAMGAGQDVLPTLNLAYEDVRAAWRHYLQIYNKGRPFVLIGHSQGTIHLTRLLAEEIEGKEPAKRMLSAIIPGFAVEVPEGKLTGGSFKTTPLCTKAGETGCVITYMSFRAEAPPPAGSFLGRALRPGMTAGCTNPAALGGGKAPLDAYWFASPAANGGTAIAWSSQGAPPVPFLRTQGLVSGECRHDGAAGYLAISVATDPKDARTDTIPGDVVMAGQVNAGWGLHPSDMYLAMGDLIGLVEAQSAAYGR